MKRERRESKKGGPTRPERKARDEVSKRSEREARDLEARLRCGEEEIQRMMEEMRKPEMRNGVVVVQPPYRIQLTDQMLALRAYGLEPREERRAQLDEVWRSLKEYVSCALKAHRLVQDEAEKKGWHDPSTEYDRLVDLCTELEIDSAARLVFDAFFESDKTGRVRVLFVAERLEVARTLSVDRLREKLARSMAHTYREYATRQKRSKREVQDVSIYFGTAKFARLIVTSEDVREQLGKI